MGAALTDIIRVAQRRGVSKLAGDWQTKKNLLQEGIRKNLTTVRNTSDTTYLEMRLPDGNGGMP